jgi:hypothetical protein
VVPVHDADLFVHHILAYHSTLQLLLLIMYLIPTRHHHQILHSKTTDSITLEHLVMYILGFHHFLCKIPITIALQVNMAVITDEIIVLMEAAYLVLLSTPVSLLSSLLVNPYRLILLSIKVRVTKRQNGDSQEVQLMWVVVV